MFLCQKCHQHDKCFSGVFLSHGPCESCGEIGDCADCHNYAPDAACNPPRAEPARDAAERAGGKP
jgi:hypothetical protein